VWMVGLDEPLIASTNALDWRSVPLDPNHPMALDVIFHVTHNALMRQQVEGIPRHYDVYCARLAGIPQQIDDGKTEALDPTRPDR
jgi:hypothetical protein